MTIGQFLPLFVELVILFLLAAAALPDEVPEEGLDLRAYYDRNGPYFRSLYTAALAWLLFIETLARLMNGDDPLCFLVDRAVDMAVVGLFASLIFVRRRWWHAFALVLLSAGPIGWLSRRLGTALSGGSDRRCDVPLVGHHVEHRADDTERVLQSA